MQNLSANLSITKLDFREHDANRCSPDKISSIPFMSILNNQDLATPPTS